MVVQMEHESEERTKTMNEKMKNKLWGVFAAALIVVFIAWMFLNPGPEHIEDTNGAENYSLQQITEKDVVSRKMGTRGSISESEIHWNFGGLDVSGGRKYSCDKFTGVHSLYTATIFKGSDIYVSLGDFQINSGNFAFYIVFDGRIVGEIVPGDSDFSEFLLENVGKTGTLEYIIAGESADFRFTAPNEW